MSPSLFDTYSNGPAVVLPPQNQFNPSFFPESHHSAPVSSPPNNAFRPGFPASFPRFSGPWPLTPATASNPSRKRSRDEFSAADNDNGYAKSSSNNNNDGPPSPPPRQRQPPVEQPIYGEGMVLLNPRTGLAISADSQTGTWCEEKSEVEAASAPAISAPVGRKSQRLDATASSWDDITASAIRQKLGSSTHDDTHRGLNNNNHNGSASAGPADPLIDDATRLLGISWQQISVEDKDIAAAIRGWERYINNHYSRSMQQAQILLQHRGLNVYLVSAQSSVAVPPAFNIEQAGPPKTQQQFYLFNEDLTEAQLIANDWNTCVQNLRTSPIVFESGSEVLRAADKTPERQVEGQGALAGSVNGNGNASEIGVMGAGGDTMMEID